MTLNNYSYCHVNIRKLCSQLEFLSGMKLLTNLSEEFYDVRFVFKYGYITLDWRTKTIFTFAHKLTDVEFAICDDIMLYLSWLETFHNWAADNSTTYKKMKGGKNNEKR